MKKYKKALCMALLAMGFVSVATVQAEPAVSSAAVQASALWNGDVPSAEVIYSFFYKGSSRYEQPLKAHGYVLTDNVTTKKAVKPGYCEMEFRFTDNGAALEIRLDDAAGRTWLVDNIRSFIKTDLSREVGYTVTQEGDVIHFDWEVDI